MDWYLVIKTINGRRYRYRQKTLREGRGVRTRSEYVCPAIIIGYHGTFAKFERFSDEHLGSANDCDSSREGFFFASNPKVAASYASTQIARQRGLQTTICTIEKRIEKTADMDWYAVEDALEKQQFGADLSNKLRHFLRMYERASKKLHDHQITRITVSKRAEVKKCILDLGNPYVYHMNGRRYDDAEFCAAIFDAKEHGHDGVIIRKTYDPGSCFSDSPITDVYVVFDPDQIRPHVADGRSAPAVSNTTRNTTLP
jgi:hypothetical protein